MTAEDIEKKEENEVIDFSKVKDWFKKKKSKEHVSHSAEQKAEETAKSDDDSEELKFDYKSTVDFFKRYSTFFLMLIPILLVIYLRVQPMQLHATDEWAQNAVYNFYRDQVVSQVNQQYPNLPDANKKALIDAEFERLLQENSGVIEQQIDATSQQFKERMMYESGDKKYVYLGDIDSYFWLRDARKIIETGRNCDEVDEEKGLCYIDTYSKAPLKNPTPLGKDTASPYVYSIVYTYKIARIFNPDITIMQASFYVPLIYGILSAILAFLVGRLIAGNFAGLITSIIISVNPVYLSRTMGSDNDPQNIFYPLLIVLFFLYTFKAKDLKNRIIFGSLTGLSIGLYSWAWQGWWFMFYFVVATLIIYAGFYILKQLVAHRSLGYVLRSKETKILLSVISLILIASLFFVMIISGAKTVSNLATSPFVFMKSKIAALETFWPNVIVTVAEFNPGSIGTIIGQMGGKLLFFLGLMGILFLMTSKDKISKEQKYILGLGALIYLLLVSNYGKSLGAMTYMFLVALPVIIGMLILLKSKEEVDVKTAVLLVIWFVATTYAALKGVRFTLLMVSAFGVAFGVTVAAIYRFVSKWISSELKINEMVTKTIIVILLLLVLIGPVKAGNYAATHFLPSVNDAWYDSLTNIRENSEPDAIINSWWDFGHWFKYIADRRVTLDGGSQSGPPLHWLGKLMGTDDEKQAVGILRMLDCGSNNAFDELNAVLNNTPKSIDILDEIVTLEKKEAGETLLENGLTKKEASAVLKYTHCDAPEDFFITSEDMVGKAGVWGHFGSWDFSRAEMYVKVKGADPEEGKKILLDPKYNLTPEQADQYYYEIQTQSDNDWITPWPSFMSPVRGCEKPNSAGVMVCNQGLSNGQQIPLVINLTNMDVQIPVKEDVKPISIVYVTEEGTEERFFNGDVLPFSIVLIPSGAGYSSLITHPYLANSMFTRLFYLEGHGLKYFDKFSDKQGVTGGRIIVWKVDWNGADPNVVYAKVDASEMESPAEEASTIETEEKEPEETTSEGTKEEPAVEETDVVEEDIDIEIPAEETNEE